MVPPRPSRPPGWVIPATAPDGAQLSVPRARARLAPGELFGGYQVLERLGAGGMAEVFSALKLGPYGFTKQVALKCMLPELAAEPRFAAMFCDEARVMARLQHPCLVQILDFGEVDGRLYMALEHIDGLSCAKLLRAVAAKRRALPPAAVLFIADQVLSGLSYAHERCDEDGRPLSLVHRDVSPGNILVGRSGEVKLTDFGILKGATLSRHTLPGELKGKLGYMSPEQVVGAEIDARSDLFTLGIVLAELSLGRPLFPGSSEMEVLDRICRGDLSVISQSGAHLPSALTELLVRALARDARDRFESARQFREAVDQAALMLGAKASADQLIPWVLSESLPSQSGTRPRVAVQLPEGLLASQGGYLASRSAQGGGGAPERRAERGEAGRLRPSVPASSGDRAAAHASARPSVLPAAGQALARPVGEPRALAAEERRSHPPRAGERPSEGELTTADVSGLYLALPHLTAGHAATWAGPLDIPELLGRLATGRVPPGSRLRGGAGEPCAVEEHPVLGRLAGRWGHLLGTPQGSPSLRFAVSGVNLWCRLLELASQGASGLLVVQRTSGAAREAHHLYLQRGRPVCALGSAKSQLLGQQLVARGLVSEADVNRALRRAALSGRRLGEELVRAGALSPGPLLHVVGTQLEERVLSVVRQRAGEVLFYPGVEAPRELLGQPPHPELWLRAAREYFSAAEVHQLLMAWGGGPVERGTWPGPGALLGDVQSAEALILEFCDAAPSLSALLERLDRDGIACGVEAERAVFLGLCAGWLRCFSPPRGPSSRHPARRG